MIEAKCVNSDCVQVNVIEILRGDLRYVQCGICQQPCVVNESDEPEQQAQP